LKSNAKSKRIFIENEDILNKTKVKQDTFFEEKVFEIKNKNIPLLDKSEKLLIINDYSKLKENEKQINVSLLNKTKSSANLANQNPYEMNFTNSDNYQNLNNDANSKIQFNNNSKSLRNSDLRNLSSKYDHPKRVSSFQNKDSILNTNGEISVKMDDFGTPNEVFENHDLSQKNLNNLKNFNNKYMNALNYIITEEDSNFNNNFFTNLETNNLNDNKNYRNNFNFEELPEENENINQDEEEANDLLGEQNAEIIYNIKYDLIKTAIFQNIKIQKDKKFCYKEKSSGNQILESSLKINFIKINKIFYENTENSNLGYVQKELILKKEEDNMGSIFYALLLESQKNDIDLYQNELFGQIYFEY
jgi:hypothetical protein